MGPNVAGVIGSAVLRPDFCCRYSDNNNVKGNIMDLKKKRAIIHGLILVNNSGGIVLGVIMKFAPNPTGGYKT
jgi:hypothetical protein